MGRVERDGSRAGAERDEQDDSQVGANRDERDGSEAGLEGWMIWLSSKLGERWRRERWTRWLLSGLGEMGLMRDGVDERRLLRGLGERSLGSRMQRASRTERELIGA